MAEPKLLSAQQIAEHNTAKDLWIVVDGQVWDVRQSFELFQPQSSRIWKDTSYQIQLQFSNPSILEGICPSCTD